MKVSKTGYKKTSKDKNKLSLLIPSNRITMKDVEFPVLGISDTGDVRIMYPGEEHVFNGNYVIEKPMKGWLNKYQDTGEVKEESYRTPWWDPNDPTKWNKAWMSDPTRQRAQAEFTDSYVLPTVEITAEKPQRFKDQETAAAIAEQVRPDKSLIDITNMQNPVQTYEDFLRSYGNRDAIRKYLGEESNLPYYREAEAYNDTLINLTNKPMGWFNFNTYPGQEYTDILGNNYVETNRGGTGKPEDYAKNWKTRMQDPNDTFRNADYAKEAGSYYHSKDIPAFYGIENKQFKVGKPEDFKDDTVIVPVRNSTTPYAKVDVEKGLFSDNYYTYDDKGNKIWNLDTKSKFLVHSPETGQTIFLSNKDNPKFLKASLEQFQKTNPGAYIISLDEGRFETHMNAAKGNRKTLNEADFRRWTGKSGQILQHYLENIGTTPEDRGSFTGGPPLYSPVGNDKFGYNIGILKQKYGGWLDNYDTMTPAWSKNPEGNWVVKAQKGQQVHQKIYTNAEEFAKANKIYNAKLNAYLKDKKAYETSKNYTAGTSSPYDEILKIADANEKRYGYRMLGYSPRPIEEPVYQEAPKPEIHVSDQDATQQVLPNRLDPSDPRVVGIPQNEWWTGRPVLEVLNEDVIPEDRSRQKPIVVNKPPDFKHGGWLDKYQGDTQGNQVGRRDPDVPFFPSSTEQNLYESQYSLPEVTVTPNWTEAELERNRLRDKYIADDKKVWRHWYDKLGYDKDNVTKRANQFAYNKLAKQYLKGDRDKLTPEQRKFIEKSEYASTLQPSVGSRFAEGLQQVFDPRIPNSKRYSLETLGNLVAPFEYPGNLVRGAVQGEFTDALKGQTPSPYFVSSDLAGTSPNEAALSSSFLTLGTDPLFLTGDDVFRGIGQGAKAIARTDAAQDAAKFLTTQTPLQHTYKLNPKAKGSLFKPWEKNMGYRVVNEEGYKDALKNFLVRANPKGDNTIFSRPTGFPSFAKGKPSKNFLKTDNTPHYIMETDVPLYARGEVNPVTGMPIKSSHGAARPIDPITGETLMSMPIEDINTIYKAQPNWLKGYERVWQSPKNIKDLGNITLGENIASSGAFNRGVYELPDYPGYLLKYDNTGLSQKTIADDIADLDFVNLQKNITSPNVGKVVRQFKNQTHRDPYYDWDTMNAYIMRRMEGTPLSKISIDELEKIPASSWQQYLDDTREIARNNSAVDIQGDNVFYNPATKEFKFIDLSPGAREANLPFWNKNVINDISNRLEPEVLNPKLRNNMLNEFDKKLNSLAKRVEFEFKNQIGNPQSLSQDDLDFLKDMINDVTLSTRLRRQALENLAKRSGYKHGGSTKWLDRYQVGEEVKSQQNQKYQDAIKWHEDWMNSPMYKQMLYEGTGYSKFPSVSTLAAGDFDFDPNDWGAVHNYDPNLIDAQRREALSDLKKTPLKISDWKESGAGGLYDPRTKDISVFPIGYNEPMLMEHEVRHAMDTQHYLDTKTYTKPEYSSYKGIPKKDTDYLKAIKERKFEDSPMFGKLTNEDEIDNWYGNRSYIQTPTEVNARLAEIRREAQQKNIYDPFTQPIPTDFFKNFDNRALQELKNYYTDEEIQYMLNHFSYNQNESNDTGIYKSKFGGKVKLKKYQGDKKGSQVDPQSIRENLANTRKQYETEDARIKGLQQNAMNSMISHHESFDNKPFCVTLPNGQQYCATRATEVLRESGYPVKQDSSGRRIKEQLTPEKGWYPTSYEQLQPGDVAQIQRPGYWHTMVSTGDVNNVHPILTKGMSPSQKGFFYDSGSGHDWTFESPRTEDELAGWMNPQQNGMKYYTYKGNLPQLESQYEDYLRQSQENPVPYIKSLPAPRLKKGGVKSSAEGYYDYINGYSGIFAKGGPKGWLDNYK